MVRFAIKFGIVIASLAVFSFGASLGTAAPNRSTLHAADEVSPPGCLIIVGEPTPPKCLPCPPPWLGGPTIRCVARLPSDAGLFSYRSAACLGPASDRNRRPGLVALLHRHPAERLGSACRDRSRFRADPGADHDPGRIYASRLRICGHERGPLAERPVARADESGQARRRWH